MNRNLLLILAGDLLLLAASLYGAYLVRFEFSVPSFYMDLFWRSLPYALVVKAAVFYFFDLYRGMWRYTGVTDLVNVIKATAVSSLAFVFILAFQYRFEGYSRSIFFIDACFTVLLIAGFRLAIRLGYEAADQGGLGGVLSNLVPALLNRGDKRRLLIVGAGDCGESISREIRNNPHLPYAVVGFLDDDPAKRGRKIHGVPVLGRVADIERIAAGARAEEIVIAIPTATAEQMRRIVDRCKATGLKFRTVPGMGELINGQVTFSAIREVSYRDLLGREVVHLEADRIGAYLAGRSVLVTGAGGSIGSELCRQICRFAPGRLVLFERAESPLYDIDLELRGAFAGIDIVPVLGDIQQRDEVERAFERHRPSVVFHAAAYKHVPMLELQPWKAIANNVLGTRCLAQVAEARGIERFVMVSTDKAVRPTSVMGASKRLAEMIVQGRDRGREEATRFITVRFGNVLNSVGSVVPLFRRQIERGGPVTVTHKEMTRYFMTIPEACQLILQAGALARGGGEIFLLDMGTPVRIDDMARDLIRHYGFEPDRDIRIEYTGLRPGEKLFEELVTEGEGILPTSHQKIMVLKASGGRGEGLEDVLADLARLAEAQDAAGIKRRLAEIVPDYTPYGTA
ncbi:MAG TPA: polysaccharide biosynthesis protein [Desulfobacteraceae bacterium]|nr:polysaccharide biosynthesis protein [Desulfobacteraceae bacterium]